MTHIKKDKGVAGLTLIVSVVTMLFVIGLLVMIFTLMGAKISETDTLYSRSDTITVTNETLPSVEDVSGEYFDVYGYRGVSCAVTDVINMSNAKHILSGNYTVTNCYIISTTATYNNTDWGVNYTYTYLYDKYGTVGVMNDTVVSFADVPDWFPLVIIMGFMVVLILLLVIIITAIRGSGLMGGSQGGA